MDNSKKIIIIALIAVIAVLSGLVAMGLMKEPVKTVELIENGTTIEVPSNANLTNKTPLGNTYVTDKNTSVMGLDNSNLAGALASKVLSELIVSHGEMQDNGLYKLDKNSIMELGDQLGRGYDEKNIKEVFVGLKHNNTVNQTVIIVGVDEKEMTDMLKSIDWKRGVPSNATVNATMNSSSSSSSSDEKTYPFYADDGSIVGYYSAGAVVEHYDGLYQLKSNGQWVYIGEAKGSSDRAYNQGYSDGIDDSDDDYDDEYYDDEYYDDEYYDDEYSSDDSGSSSSSNSK